MPAVCMWVYACILYLCACVSECVCVYTYVFVLIILGVLMIWRSQVAQTFVRGSKAYILNNIMQCEYRQHWMKSVGSLPFNTYNMPV